MSMGSQMVINMNLKRNFVFLFLLLILFSVNSKAADNCTKEAFSVTTLEKYKRSKYVLIAKGISVEKVKKGENANSLFGIKSIKMVVEKVFKGNLFVGSEIVLAEGNGNDDVDSFRESDVGRSYLLFLCSPQKKPNVFQVLRGMNDYLADESAEELRYHENSAAGDLLYLEKLDELRGKTRIYGKIGTNQDTYYGKGKEKTKIFSRVKVRISGNGQTYDTTTNEDGVYEIYDLPPGTYSISPEIPKGWEISDVTSYGSTGGDDLVTTPKLSLRKGNHAFFDFNLEANTTINGKVVDPNGQAMKSVCLGLMLMSGKMLDFYGSNDCTDKKGNFTIENLVSGNYLIVVNKDNKISSSEPFPTLYYPNVFSREKAQIITVNEGENQNGIVIQVPEVKETIYLSGKLLSSDGVPVVRARISFVATETNENIDGSNFALTDEEGKFLIKILRGLKGNLLGFVTLDQNQFKDCPQTVKLINENGKIDWRNKKSNTIEIKADENFDDLELKLPFPSCNKTKIISRIRVD